jgi:hypothetical protein
MSSSTTREATQGGGTFNVFVALTTVATQGGGMF